MLAFAPVSQKKDLLSYALFVVLSLHHRRKKVLQQEVLCHEFAVT